MQNKLQAKAHLSYLTIYSRSKGTDLPANKLFLAQSTVFVGCQHCLLGISQPAFTSAIKLSSKEHSVWQKNTDSSRQTMPYLANSDQPFIQGETDKAQAQSSEVIQTNCNQLTFSKNVL